MNQKERHPLREAREARFREGFNLDDFVLNGMKEMLERDPNGAEVERVKNNIMVVSRSWDRDLDLDEQCDLAIETLMMMENEKTDEEVIRHGIEKWERRLCREEGIMLKKIKEALHDDGRK